MKTPLATAAFDAGASTVDDLHPDILTQILRLLDGPTLAAASCSTSNFRTLVSEPEIWRRLCISSWPSLSHPRLIGLLSSSPNSHRSFFSDAYPFPLSTNGGQVDHCQVELISAIDIHHRGENIFSKVVETETQSPWFHAAPFRIDARDRKDPPSPEHVSTTLISPEHLTLSWIIVDPSTHRAVNVSSRQPVSVDRHWYTGETQVRFATVLANGTATATAVVTLGSETMQIAEVTLTVEREDGAGMNGKESLAALHGVLEGKRVKGSGKEEGYAEVKERYREYKRRRKEKKQRKVRREGLVDTIFVLVGVCLFLGFLARIGRAWLL